MHGPAVRTDKNPAALLQSSQSLEVWGDKKKNPLPYFGPDGLGQSFISWPPGENHELLFLGLSMAGLSLICFFSPDLQLPGDAFWNSWAQGNSIVLIFVALTVYLILFNPLGFCLDTFLLMIFLTKAAGAKGFKSSLLLSLVTMVVIYIVFYKMLIIPFPAGILGI